MAGWLADKILVDLKTLISLEVNMFGFLLCLMSVQCHYVTNVYFNQSYMIIIITHHTTTVITIRLASRWGHTHTHTHTHTHIHTHIHASTQT